MGRMGRVDFFLYCCSLFGFISNPIDICFSHTVAFKASRAKHGYFVVRSVWRVLILFAYALALHHFVATCNISVIVIRLFVERCAVTIHLFLPLDFGYGGSANTNDSHK